MNMIKFSKAAILQEIGSRLVIESIEIPKLVYGQVLVKVLYSGVCRSQLMEIQGGRGRDNWLPHLLGHEGSGIVVDVGKGVTKVKLGDEVILSWIKSSGLSAPGAKYLLGNKVINSGQVTTFSNYTIASENRLVIKPPGLPFDTAILFGCALPTGAGMVLNELKPTKVQSVIVLGLGGVGLAALIALKATGIRLIIGVDMSDHKLALAKKLGAMYVFNSNQEGFHQSILEITGGGANLCIESGGQIETIELGFSLIRKNGGSLLFASHPSEGKMIQLSPHELISGKKITGSWGGATCPERDIPIMYDLFKSTNTPLNELLTQQYSLEQINEALDDLEAGKVLRPLIAMQHSE